jgi:hypothetical protein
MADNNAWHVQTTASWTSFANIIKAQYETASGRSRVSLGQIPSEAEASAMGWTTGMLYYKNPGTGFAIHIYNPGGWPP